MKKETNNASPVQINSLQVNLDIQIIEKLRTMEKNTKKSVDELVTTALKFFIATHNDYLGKR